MITDRVGLLDLNRSGGMRGLDQENPRAAGAQAKDSLKEKGIDNSEKSFSNLLQKSEAKENRPMQKRPQNQKMESVRKNQAAETPSSKRVENEVSAQPEPSSQTSGRSSEFFVSNREKRKSQIEEVPGPDSKNNEASGVEMKGAKAQAEVKVGERSFFPNSNSEDKWVNAKVQLSQGQDVMLKFMDSMESELGVPQEEMAVAMTSLMPNQSLEAMTSKAAASVPSSDEMKSVIQQLDLSPDEKEKALALYMSAMTQQKSAIGPELSPLLSSEQIATGAMAAGSFAALKGDEALQSKERMLSTVDQLNNRFFMRGANAQGVPDPEVRSAFENELNAKMNPAGIEAQNFNQAESFTAGYPQMAQGLQKKNLAKFADQAEAFNGLQAMKMSPNPELEFAKNISGNASDGGAELLEDGSAQTLGQTVDGGKPQLEAAFGRFFDTRGSADATARAAAGAAVAAGAGAVISDKENASNMQQILNQTQYMIRKGGGEATVKMSPEGLGQVQLKVTLEDGKVNVQMSTETQDAKKILESSFADLKTHLASHKLHVDQLKVDVGNQAQFDFQNSKMDAQQDQNRERASQFFQQWRDEGLFQQRSQFLEMPELKAQSAYRSSAQPLSPEPLRQKARAMGDGRGRELNLVA